MPKKGQTSKRSRSREVSQADLTADEKVVDDKIKEPSTSSSSSSSSDQPQAQGKETEAEVTAAAAGGMKEEEEQKQQPEQEKEQEQEQPSTMQDDESATGAAKEKGKGKGKGRGRGSRGGRRSRSSSSSSSPSSSPSSRSQKSPSPRSRKQSLSQKKADSDPMETETKQKEEEQAAEGGGETQQSSSSSSSSSTSPNSTIVGTHELRARSRSPRSRPVPSKRVIESRHQNKDVVYGEMLNRLKEIQTLREKKQALTRELFTQDPDMNRETWKRTVKKELGVDPALFDPAEESTLKQKIVEMMDQEDKEKSESIENELKDKVSSMNGGGLSDKDEDLQACKKALHMAGGKEALLQQDEVIEAMKPISEQLKARVAALTEKMTLYPDFGKPDLEDLKEIKAKELEIAKYRQQLESEMKGESRASSSSSSSSGGEPALKKAKTSESDTQPDIQNSAPEVTATGAETA